MRRQLVARAASLEEDDLRGRCAVAVEVDAHPGVLAFRIGDATAANLRRLAADGFRARTFHVGEALDALLGGDVAVGLAGESRALRAHADAFDAAVDVRVAGGLLRVLAMLGLDALDLDALGCGAAL